MKLYILNTYIPLNICSHFCSLKVVHAYFGLRLAHQIFACNSLNSLLHSSHRSLVFETHMEPSKREQTIDQDAGESL